jgi:hypothetical protein
MGVKCSWLRASAPAGGARALRRRASLHHPAEHALVEIVAAEHRVAAGRHDFENPFDNFRRCRRSRRGRRPRTGPGRSPACRRSPLRSARSAGAGR